jgi:hypothetical protein
MLSYLSLPACNWVFLANTVVTDEIYLFTGEFPHNVLSPNFYTHICMCERFIYFQDRLSILLQPNMWTDDPMNI